MFDQRSPVITGSLDYSELNTHTKLIKSSVQCPQSAALTTHGENSASVMSSVSQNFETKLSDEIKLCFQIFQVRFCVVRY